MRILYTFIPVLVAVSLHSDYCAAAENTHSPATYHLSFDSMAFLKDDLAAAYTEPSLEQRNLRLVEGAFGKALCNDNEFRREDLEKTSMSTWDLDPLLEVLVHRRFGHWKDYKIGRMQPYFWGTGRLSGEGGAVAFWAKGARTFPGYIFFQGSSSFGRHEQYLIAIELHENGSLSAYVRDTAYRYHRITSSPVWDSARFNHVALVWDRAQGLSLYLNGEKIASNWGTDAWWSTQTTGLFHFPMSGFIIDECWLFDRAITSSEVSRLMKKNTPPRDTRIVTYSDTAALKRLKESFIGQGEAKLPAVRPYDGSRTMTMTEVFPEWTGCGCVEAPFVLDGKYELAWPQDYTTFTNILGDSDFHPEYVDIRPPEDTEVNYFTIEGNLALVKLMAGNRDGSSMTDIISVPSGAGVFYGVLFPARKSGMYRIPFLTGYGSPEGYKPGLNLALTGDVRIHEVGLYNVSYIADNEGKKTLERLYLSIDGEIPGDARTGYAIRTVNNQANSRIVTLAKTPAGSRRWIKPGPFQRLNLLSDVCGENRAITAVEIDCELRKVTEGDFVIIRLHDPGVPARLWNTVAVRLEGFEKGMGRLKLKLDCTDIKCAPSDRLWIDIAFSGGEEVAAGANASSVNVSNAALMGTDGRYAEKALKPARSDFTKIYYWYYPWRAMNWRPSADNPPTFGGFYDIVTYPLIVKRTEPDNFIANTLIDLSLITQPDEVYTDFTMSRDRSPELWPPVKNLPAEGVPEWAFYMNYYLSRYKEIVDWWAERQNPDGQVGGGWNDDVLFASRLTGVFLYCGDEKARGIFNRIFAGLEGTNMFRDGYCNIDPMDYIHVEDLVRNRYEGLLFEPGDPEKMLISFRTAWHHDKPDSTPVNYIDGASFKYDHDLVSWYWGDRPAFPAYKTTCEEVTAKMKEIGPSMDEVIRFRYTEAGMYTDGSFMPGCYDVKRIQVGGGWGPKKEAITLAASWEKGGGPDIPKWVESATDTSFTAHLYSFSPVEETVAVRLYRLVKGRYRITLDYEGNDADKGRIIERIESLKRFSDVSFSVRPGRECVVKIEIIERLHDSEKKPDLSIKIENNNNRQITVRVYNFGNGIARGVVVRALDNSGASIEEKTIDSLPSAITLTPGVAELTFANHNNGIAVVTVDPDDRIEEIYEKNNIVRYKEQP